MTRGTDQHRATLSRRAALGAFTGAAAFAAFAACDRKARETSHVSPPGPAPPAPASSAPASPASAAAGTVRIVALSPAVAIILRDMGYADRIVGRHGFDLVLDPTVPVCGDQAGIDFEALIRVTPTHVFTQWGSRDLPERLTQLASKHAWRLLDTRLLALDDIPDAALRMDRELAGPEGSPAGRELVAQLRAAFAARAPKEKADVFQGPVLLLAATTRPAALGPGSFHHQLLERLGGVPVIREGHPYIELAAEDAVRLAPRGIVLILPRSPDNATRTADTEVGPRDPMQRLGALRGLTIPAVSSGRVVLIDDPLALTPSSALRGVADSLDAALRRWNRQP